jgi:dTDP-4-dehydrorhamnose 3,5-epimerase
LLVVSPSVYRKECSDVLGNHPAAPGAKEDEDGLMHFTPTAIPDVVLIEPRVLTDDRGFFLETFQARKYAPAGVTAPMVQDNHSGSRRGVLRGLHYQIRCPQGKLVSVLAGEVFDVAVDLRRSSPTFCQWVGLTLTARDRRQMWVPPGFAHGFYVLSEWAEVCYKATDFYNPEYERTLLWNDPEVGVRWPMADGEGPVLSPKDAIGSPLSRAEVFE